MIEIKTFAKSKKSNSTSGGSTSGGSYVVGTASESEHALTADKAKRAESSDKSDYATKASTAQNANYAAVAGELAKDSETLQDYLYKGETEEVQEVKGKVNFKDVVTFLSEIVAEATAKLNQGATFGNNGAYIDHLGDAVLNSLRSLDYSNAAEQGFSIEKEASGKYHAFITNLTVWGKAVFHELEIRKLSYAGGNIYLSGAGSKLIKVVPVKWNADTSSWEESTEADCEGWKCYLLADDGTTATMNYWKEGDQVKCQTMGQITSGGTYQDVSNKSYWRTIPDNGVSTVNEKIYGTKTETYLDDEGNEQTREVQVELYDGQAFAWIVIGKHGTIDGYDEEGSGYSSTDYSDTSKHPAPLETCDIPAEGDTIVLDGNRKRGDDGGCAYEDRQNVIMMETTGDDAPRIVGYYHVTEYKHTYTNDDGDEVPLYVFLLSAKEGVKFNSSSFEWISADGSAINMINYRGDWSKDSTYSKNDQVNYDNAVWVCIANSGDKVKGEEPSDTSTVWKKVLEGGKGEDAYQYILTCNPTVLHLDKDGNFASNALSSDSSKATIGAFLYVSKGGKAVSIKDGDITWYLSRNGSAEGYNGSDNECTFNISNTDKDIAIIAVYDGLQVAQQSIPIVKDGEDGAPAEAYSISLIKETRTIGSVSGQPVIAVHFYWQKGDKSTSTGRITELGDNAFVQCYVDGEYNSSMTNRINGGNDYFDYAAYESIWNGKSTISIALYIGSDNLVASANFSLGQSGEGVVMAYKNSDTQPAKPNVTDLANLASLGWSRKPQKGGSYEKVTDISYGSYSNGNNSTSDSTAKSWTSLSDGSNTWMKSPSGLSDSYGWAIMKVTFRTNADNVNVYAVIKAYSETNFDYIQLHALDTEITGSNSLYKNGVSYVSGNGIEQSYTYNVANAGEHFFYVSYCKDSSGNSYGDYGLFRFDLSANQASTPSTVWMSQATLKDGKAVLPWSDAVQITGEDGKDAYRVVISPSTLVLDTDDTGNVTTFPTDKTASISIYKGSDDVTSSFWKNDIYPSNYSNCNGRIANLNSKPYNVYVTAIDSDKYTDPTTGKDTNVSKTNGFLEFYLTNGTDTVIAHVNVQVNMAKYMGSVQWNNEQWSSKYAELSNSLSGKLADFKTEVEQNARQWSVEASQKAAGRRNLLVGSAFRKQNDGTYKLSVGTCSIEKNTGIDGVNCAHSVNTYNGSSQSYNGVFWDGSQTGTSAQSIKIERGKKYTISCWVKCDRTDVLISLESIYTDKQTGATRKTKPKTTTNRFYVSKANVWELFSCVIDTSLNGDGTQNTQYDYVAVNIWCVHTLTDESGKGITVNAYFCKPMLEEGDTYNGWTLSEQDYDYVGGNLLDNVRTTLVGGNLNEATATLLENGYGDCNVRKHFLAAGSTLNDYSGEVFKWLFDSTVITRGKDYMFSFMARCESEGGRIVCYLWKGDGSSDPDVVIEGSNGYVTQNESGSIAFELTTEWKRYWVHWRPLITGGIPQGLNVRHTGINVNGSYPATNVYVTQPKLEEGATMTEWTERKTDLIDKASLKAAGILVDANAVTLYGNQIHIKSKKDSGDDAFLIDTDTGKVTAGLIDADTIVAKGIKTQALEAQNLNVTGNSQLGIFKIKTSEGDKRDNYTISGDMITYSGSYKLPDGKTNVVSNDGLAYLMYKPLFIRQGASDIGKYMRLGNCYTEWDDCGNGDGDSYLFHGAAARYVCSSSSGTCEMYALPQTLGYNTNYKPVSYIYSTKVSQDDPALAIYVQSKGTSGERTAIQTNAAIRGVFASNAKSISYSQTISTGVGLVICTNPSEMTLTLPPNPIEGQTLIIIQGSTAKVWIDPNGKTIYCGGVTKTSSNKFCSNTVGQFNIFIYVNGYWQLQFINNKA